ncbi:MAG: ArsR family transcriptional regulator, partial [Bacilli bacterium]
VKSRKVGKIVFYSLKDDHVNDLFRIALEHIREEGLVL